VPIPSTRQHQRRATCKSVKSTGHKRSLPQESQDQELRVKAVWNHGIAPLYGGVRGHCTRFLGRWNYPQRGGTRPRSAAVVRRWRFFEAASVEGGRLELDESRLRRASRASTRFRRQRNWRRTLVGVCCQSCVDMPSPSGRGTGSSPSLTMPTPRVS